MGLFSKKQPVAASAEDKGGKPQGRSLAVYFLPTLLISVVLPLFVALLALQYITETQRKSTTLAVTTSVNAVAERLEAVIGAKRELLSLLSRNQSLQLSLMDGDSATLAAIAQTMQQHLPGARHLRLFSQLEQPQLDSSGPAPMGYAGVDMVKRALKGKIQPVEVHQIKAGNPYLAMVVPVKREGQVIGALFAAWDERIVSRVVASAPMFPGRFRVIQGGNGGYVLAETSTSKVQEDSTESITVRQTIWQISYSIDKVNVAGEISFIGILVLAGIVVLILGIFLQHRWLSRELRQDMATLVNLGESILQGQGTADVSAQVRVSHSAVALLTEYARTRLALSSDMPVHPKPSGALLSQKEQSGAALDASDIVVEEDGGADDAQEPATGSMHNAATAPMDIPLEMFRAYDIRGVVEEILTPAIAQRLGQAFGQHLATRGIGEVLVARDARFSSPGLTAALCDGLVEQGMRVLDLGQTPVGVLYFSMHNRSDCAAVMVTGSHNPTEYNGFKLYVDTVPVQGEDLLALRESMLAGQFESDEGNIEKLDNDVEYLDVVSSSVPISRSFKVVVDGGNGVAGQLAVQLLEGMGCEVVPLFCEPDGSFPNHHPDPSDQENLASLALEVQAQTADLGLAFDGDGDRIGLVDNNGDYVWPEHLLMLLSGDILLSHPGTDVVYDVKSSAHLAGFILANGGRPIMWQSGHTRMKAKMRETGALIGGEFSGHYFIKDRWYGTDDAVYVAARLLEVLSADPRTLAEIVAELPASVPTQEFHLSLDEGQADALMAALLSKANFAEARKVDLDGLRVEYSDGWGLVRQSNTTPSLTFRFEAESEARVEQIQASFRALLKQVVPDLQAPF